MTLLATKMLEKMVWHKVVEGPPAGLIVVAREHSFQFSIAFDSMVIVLECDITRARRGHALQAGLHSLHMGGRVLNQMPFTRFSIQYNPITHQGRIKLC